MGRKILTCPRPTVFALVIPRQGVVMSKDGHLAIYDTHAEAVRHLREGQEIAPFNIRREK